jgi:hypothetical protein
MAKDKKKKKRVPVEQVVEGGYSTSVITVCLTESRADPG